MKNNLIIKPNKKYSLKELVLVANNQTKVSISQKTKNQLTKNCQAFFRLENQKVYGATTGLADLCQNQTKNQALTQQKMLLSHSCGMGENLSKKTTRAIIFSRLINLSKAQSGVRPELIQFLADLLKKDITPLTPKYGSIGCSDLTILAQIFASIYNQGQVMYQNQVITPYKAFKKANLTPPKTLINKEALSLINGNDATIGLSGLTINKLNNLFNQSIVIAALALEARNSNLQSLSEINQIAKPFYYQNKVSNRLLKLLRNSKLAVNSPKSQYLQEPLSFRCIPQSLGNIYRSFNQAKKTYLIELNSLTDNPLIRNNPPASISSANFYCGQLATSVDQLSISLAQLASVTCARMQILTNDQYNNKLPKYLIKDSTNNSGLMIPIYTAQSLKSEIQALSYPRSVLSQSVANNWEDISTNAFNASLNLEKITNLFQKILAIELLVTTQALSLRLKSSKSKQAPKTKNIYNLILNAFKTKQITFPLTEDVYLYQLLKTSNKILNNKNIINQINKLTYAN